MIKVGFNTSGSLSGCCNSCNSTPCCCKPSIPTYCCPPRSGLSDDYIWNQFDLVQPANYRIDGTGEVGILNITQGKLNVIGTPMSMYMEYITNAPGVGQRFYVGEENVILTLNPDGNSRFAGRTAGQDAIFDDEYITKRQLDDFTITETDPTVPAWVKAITTTNIANWNAAYQGLVTAINFSAGVFTLTQLSGATLTTNIDSDDIPEGTSNLYYSNSRVMAYADTRYSLLGHSHDLGGPEIYGIAPIVKGGTGLNVLGTANQILHVNPAGTALEYFTPNFLVTETDPTVPAWVKAISTIDITNWNVAYETRIVAVDVTGTDTKTITLTRGDGSTIANTFNDQGILSVAVQDSATVTWTGDGTVGNPLIATAIGTTGTVTSVGLAMPSIFTVTNSPVTTIGTLTASLNTQAANTVFAGPTAGSAAVPTFRALVAADIPNLAGNYILNQFASAQVGADFWVDGDGRVGGTFTADQGGFNSDINFKNVLRRGLDIDLNILNKLDVIEYTWKDKNDNWIHYGYSAQEVEQLLPSAVIRGGEKLSVNYTELHTLALAEAGARIAKLEKMVEYLINRNNE